MIDILISENIAGAPVDALRSKFKVAFEPDLWKNRKALTEAISGARAIIVRNNTDVDAALLRAATNLIAVGRAGVGLDNIDMKAATELGIVVAFTPDQNSISAAELALAFMMALARNIPAASADTCAGNWNRNRFMGGTELYGKTLGIIGAGKIGFLTASRARAFGMNILAYDPFLSEDHVFLRQLCADQVELDELLSRSDFVSCHVPASPATDGMLDAARLRRMKKTAFLVNTSRGRLIVEEDLIEALKTGVIAGAALDVRRTEPPQPGELEKLPNVILTPHIGAFTVEAQERVTRTVCADIERLLAGQPALNPATPFRLPQRKA
jgi:D-3-phosphoglycerate dehydrogenase